MTRWGGETLHRSRGCSGEPTILESKAEDPPRISSPNEVLVSRILNPDSLADAIPSRLRLPRIETPTALVYSRGKTWLLLSERFCMSSWVKCRT